MIVAIALIAFATAQFIDGASTIRALRSADLEDRNPAVRRLYARYGVAPSVVLLKLLAWAFAFTVSHVLTLPEPIVAAALIGATIIALAAAYQSARLARRLEG